MGGRLVFDARCATAITAHRYAGTRFQLVHTGLKKLYFPNIVAVERDSLTQFVFCQINQGFYGTLRERLSSLLYVTTVQG